MLSSYATWTDPIHEITIFDVYIINITICMDLFILLLYHLYACLVTFFTFLKKVCKKYCIYPFAQILNSLQVPWRSLYKVSFTNALWKDVYSCLNSLVCGMDNLILSSNIAHLQ